ncbi:MAG: hypothetical protein H7098_11240, partial [Oligoflexus sp.]|nr:hypothetical protein [Pseudopedobacter sp.]
MNSRFDNFFRIFFAFTDLGFLCVLHLVLLLNYNFDTNSANISHVVFFIMTNIFWLMSSYLTEVYINDRILNFRKFSRRTVRAFIIFIVLLLIYLFFTRFRFNRQYIYISFGTFALYLFISRLIFLQIALYIGKKKRALNKIIILGNNAFAYDLVTKLRKTNKTLDVLGCFSEEARIENNEKDFIYLGKVEDCIKYAIANQVTEIYSTLSPEILPEIYDIAQSAENLCMRFRFVPDFRNFVNKSVYF